MAAHLQASNTAVSAMAGSSTSTSGGSQTLSDQREAIPLISPRLGSSVGRAPGIYSGSLGSTFNPQSGHIL